MFYTLQLLFRKYNWIKF